MARSYGRGKAARKGGLLVRENPTTRAVSVNSLYCVPVRFTIAGGQDQFNIVRTKSSGWKNMRILEFMKASNTVAHSLQKCVRVSSIELSSKSPFTVLVRSPYDEFCYKCVGQSVNKIKLPVQNSIAGNASLLLQQEDNFGLISIADAEDQVDILVNVVINGGLASY